MQTQKPPPNPRWLEGRNGQKLSGVEHIENPLIDDRRRVVIYMQNCWKCLCVRQDKNEGLHTMGRFVASSICRPKASTVTARPMALHWRWFFVYELVDEVTDEGDDDECLVSRTHTILETRSEELSSRCLRDLWIPCLGENMAVKRQLYCLDSDHIIRSKPPLFSSSLPSSDQ